RYGADDRVPASGGVAEVLAEPPRWDECVNVGGGQPDGARVEVPGPAEHLPHACPACRADTPRVDRQDPGPAPLGIVRGPVGARVRDHDEVDRYRGQHPDRLPDGGQAGGQQVLFVVRGDHYTDGLDHASPPVWATEGGSPSVRM